jgi:hypothetical protein
MSSTTPPTTDDSQSSAVISVVFWCSLVVAVGLFSLVAFAPKWLAHVELWNRRQANQVRLVTLERQVHDLGKVVHSLETDAEFAAQLARIDFDASRPGDERIAVSADHALDARTAPMAFARPAVSLPWYAPLLRLFAFNRTIRYGMLAIAAAIAILAFTFLHESQTAPLTRAVGTSQSLLTRVVERYRRS